MSKDIAIAVQNVSKDFHMSSDGRGSIKDLFIHPVRSAKKRNYKSHHVLKDISFEIEKGEFFGIVGRNGSGKSTLLKILANIYQPTNGSVTIDGRLVSFIELGVGFNPDLTGRENVYLNGALMGFSTKEVDAMYDEIVEFAELEEFMDEQLKNYSSGMQVRLAFSVATRSKSDILVLDEVLAVGDEAFQRKCENYFAQAKKNGKTIVLVTHDMGAVQRFCNKAMMIRDGNVVAYGSPEDVSNQYSIENLDSPKNKETTKKVKEDVVIKNFKAELLSPKTINQNGKVEIKISYETTRDIETYPVCDLRDMDRNAPLVTAGSGLTSDRSVTRTWSINLSAINNTKVIANFVVRNKDNDIIYFLPNSKSPKFIIRRNDYPNPNKPTTYALLFDKGEWDG